MPNAILSSPIIFLILLFLFIPLASYVFPLFPPPLCVTRLLTYCYVLHPPVLAFSVSGRLYQFFIQLPVLDMSSTCQWPQCLALP